ncbi:Tat pathway signal sequence domain protein, partial [Streptomyces sp. GC420]|nr:Tat pathway signal sequence domain protein [Streptomyces sp. GC420]
ELSYHDDKADTLVTKTVNLETGKVEQTDTQRGVQPPPTGAEAREAAELLIAAPLGKGLKADYKDATSKELTSADQLTVTGMVYQVSAERPGPASLGECGTHRCVTLFTKVKNGPWIDTRSLVVDLSARKVGSIG